LIIALTVTFLGCPSTPVKEHKSLVVFLVRHAEKVDASKDPELSESGKKRSEDLAAVLRSAGLGHVHSTDFIRTRETAAPVATLSGVEIETYNPKDLEGFAKELKEAGGRHLVVGHSNTTPELTKLLGGDPGAEIDEKSEYDRLYIVTIGKDGTVNSVLIRFGERFEKSEDKKSAAAGA